MLTPCWDANAAALNIATSDLASPRASNVPRAGYCLIALSPRLVGVTDSAVTDGAAAFMGISMQQGVAICQAKQKIKSATMLH